MNQLEIERNLDAVLTRYQSSFSEKIYSEENEEFDLLMNAFSITPQVKRENKQYWGRELGHLTLFERFQDLIWNNT